MHIRAFRRLSRAKRRELINTVSDPLARRVLEIAFLGPGKVSWVKVAMMISGDNTPNTICQIAHRALAEISGEKPVTFCPESHATISPDGPATPRKQAYHGRARKTR